MNTISTLLTKRHIAAAHLISAIRLFFDDGPNVSIYLLSSAAREILTRLADHAGKESMIDLAAKANSLSRKEAIAKAHGFANKLKHADRDPDDLLTMPEDAVDGVLFIACRDFMDFSENPNTVPVEIQLFELWFYAAYPKGLEQTEFLNVIQKIFPNLNTRSRVEQKAVGKHGLAWAHAEFSVRE